MSPMLAVDVPLIALALGVAALCIATASTVLGVLPGRRARRSRQATPPFALPPGPTRRVITGPPATLPPVDTMPPPAQPAFPRSRHEAVVDDARATIEQMLADDPESVARMLASWIRVAEPPARRPGSSRP